MWKRSVNNYISYRTLSKTTRKAGLVQQQRVEAKAGVVPDG